MEPLWILYRALGHLSTASGSMQGLHSSSPAHLIPHSSGFTTFRYKDLLSSLHVPGTLPPQYVSSLLFLCLECSSPGPGKRQTPSQPSYIGLNITHSLKTSQASHQIPLCYASLFPCLCSSYHYLKLSCLYIGLLTYFLASLSE